MKLGRLLVPLTLLVLFRHGLGFASRRSSQMCSCSKLSKFAVTYTDRKGGVKNLVVCRWCDLCERWPNWKRGLKERV